MRNTYKIILTLLLIVQEAFSNQKVNNCLIQQIVFLDQQNLTPFIVCQECVKGFVVNYDFKSCIKASSLPSAQFSYCKRLDRYNNCDEALCTIQIDQDELFIPDNKYQYDTRCAKVDTINKICISPRFPYTLNILTNKIYQSNNSYCKIFTSTCIQNYEAFYGIQNTQIYIYLSNFQNVNLIMPNTIFHEQIQCVEKYIYKPAFQNYPEGCYPLSFSCQKNDGYQCQCSDGEAVDSTYSKCMKYQNCQQYGFYYNILYCIKCNFGYFKGEFQNDCSIPCIVDEVNQICKYCTSQDQVRKGNYCDIYSGLIENCIKNNSQGECIECKTGYFANIVQNTCQVRQLSAVGCTQVNPRSDQCLTLSCQQNYSLNQQFLSILGSDYGSNPQLLQFQLNQVFNQGSNIPSGMFAIAGVGNYEINTGYDLTNFVLMKDVYYSGIINSQICIPQTGSVQGCIQYLGSICLQCSTGSTYYIYQNAQAISKCGSSSDMYVSNCKVIQGTVCYRCSEGFLLNSAQQCVIGTINNCQWYDSSANCISCKSPYLLTNGQCVFISNNCASYEISSTSPFFAKCTQCTDIYSYQLSYTDLYLSYVCNPYNQIKYEPCIFIINGQCQLCGFGYQLQNNSCVLIVPALYNCSFYDGIKEKCNICIDNYFLDDGICYPTTGSCPIYQVQNQSYPDQNLCNIYPKQSICNYTNKQGQYLANVIGQIVYQKCTLTKQQSSCKRCFGNICLDEQHSCDRQYGWSQTFQACFPQCLNDKLDFSFYGLNVKCEYAKTCDKSYIQSIKQFQCSDCSLVTQISQCNTSISCAGNLIYSSKFDRCMSSCDQGKIAFDQFSCAYSENCQDGLDWNEPFQRCAYNQCENGFIAVIDSCLKSKDTKHEQNQSSTFSFQWFEFVVVVIALCIIAVIILQIWFNTKSLVFLKNAWQNLKLKEAESQHLMRNVQENNQAINNNQINQNANSIQHLPLLLELPTQQNIQPSQSQTPLNRQNIPIVIIQQEVEGQNSNQQLNTQEFVL